MKKLLVCIALALGVTVVASPVFADGSAEVATGLGSAVVAPDTGSATVTPAAGSDAASTLHDPTKNPGATLDDLKLAKKTGWGLALFAALVILCRFILPLVSSRLAFLREGKTAVIVGAVGAAAVAGYDALAGGASWVALLGVLFGAVLHYIDAKPAAKS